MVWIAYLLYLITLIGNEANRKTLHGKWTILGDGKNVSVHTKRVLDSYSMLWKAGLIKDPLIGTHDTDYRWIANRNWTFVHTFQWNRTITSYTTVELIWPEVDTFCQVNLNGHVLSDRTSHGDNSFLTRTWLIGDWIRIGQENRLSLECVSTNEMAKRIANSSRSRSQPVPPPDCWPSVFRGECHINLVRTTQASFGWDWGPAFPIQGFWQLPQIVQSYRGLRLGPGFRLFTAKTNSPGQPLGVWSAQASVEVRFSSLDAQAKYTFCLYFRIDEILPGTKRQCYRRHGDGMAGVDVPLSLFTNLSGVTPWWPNGISTGPRTYTMHVNLTTIRGVVLDRAKHIIGFREFELREERILPDQPMQGLSFYFLVNGLPVFAKGANWIPSRILPGRSVGFVKSTTGHWSRDQLAVRRLLVSAAAAGINVIRIWGGGRYEPEWFYREADRLGLMIWHDMMFAVATYAARDNRLNVSDTVEQEIREQIRRLHSHPSIVIWATDNEVKQAVNDGWYGTRRDPQLLRAFKDRFVDSIARVVNEEEQPNRSDRQQAGIAVTAYRPRRCLISSPSNGRLTEEQKGLDTNPQDPRYGDVHYYIYSGNLWSETNYPITRFTSEFGIQSLPSPLAWKRSLVPGPPMNSSDWDIDGPLMRHRQHHSSGQALFILAAQHIGQPKNTSNAVLQYSRWAYLTQLNQLMSYRTHINLLMRHQCRLANMHEQSVIPWERTSMGAMYWQLNDVWSAPTWSTVDAAGQWKMAHYGAVRHCFDNHPFGHLSAQILYEQVQVDWIPPVQLEHLIRRPDRLQIRCLTIDSFQPTFEWMLDIDWPQQNRTCPVMILNMTVASLVTRCKFGTMLRAKTLIQLEMLWGQRNGESIGPGGTVLLLDLPAKIDRWPTGSGQKGIRIEDLRPIDQTSGAPRPYPVPLRASAVFQMRVRSKSPELFVWLELDPDLDVEYWFDRNAFNILNGEGQEITLFVSDTRQMTVDLIRSNLRFHSLSTIHQSYEEEAT